MKVSGSAALHAPQAAVWDALNDPAVLVRTIPGCERLEATGPDSYKIIVTAGVASVRGTYAGEVSLTDQVAPSSFTLKASGAGGPGTVSTEVKVVLSAGADGTTELSYDADAVVGGVIAGVGQRMLASVGRKTADEFFRSVDDVLTGRDQAAVLTGRDQAAVLTGRDQAAVPAGATPSGVTGAEPGSQPAVYTSPRAAARQAGGPGFAAGALTGAAAALAGVLAGWLLGRRNR